jgi:hypothetical protein
MIAICLALSLLLLGLGYSFPGTFFSKNFHLPVGWAVEVFNLYCLVSWMGLAHFFYAFGGQFKSIQTSIVNTRIYWSIIFIGLLVLVFLRGWIGVQGFNALIWLYFLPHFIRAEKFFDLKNKDLGAEVNNTNLIGLYVFPTVCFGFLTLALYTSLGKEWLICLTILWLLLSFYTGMLSGLKNPRQSRFILLGMFFLAETLIWGAYKPYMHPAFKQGVYVFHIALASFYHYFRAYDFALHQPNGNLSLSKIILTNTAFILLGIGIFKFGGMRNWLFNPEYFTIWVGWHVLASDLFNMLKKLQKSHLKVS